MHLPRVLAAMATAVVVGTAAAISGPAAPAGADDCPDVEVIFARGTGEAPGVGRVGQAFIDALAPQLGGRALDSYGVNYPASLNFLAASSGAADAAAALQAAVKDREEIAEELESLFKKAS